MVFERQSRGQKGVGALPRNALQTSPTTGTATASSSSPQRAQYQPQQQQSQQQQSQQQQQLPPKSATSLLAGNSGTNKGLVTASLGLRSLLGSARASSIFLDNDSLVLPSDHGDNDEDYDDDVSASCDSSSLNLSLNTMGGGGYGMGSAASISGSSVLTVANTVTEDPFSTTTSSTTAMMVAAELNGRGGGGGVDAVNMTTPQQVATTTAAVPKTTSAGVRSWMTKTATITRSVNSKHSITSPAISKRDALSQAETPAASGSRPQPSHNNIHATPATAAPSCPPTTPAANTAADIDNELKIVATASMITLDSTTAGSPQSASPNNSNINNSTTTTLRKNQVPILPNGTTKTTAGDTSGLLLAPPSSIAEDDSCIHPHHDDKGEDEEDDGLNTMYNINSKNINNNRPMSTFCQYGPRWLKFLLIISIVFLLASVALVAVGVSMQYVDVAVANSNSPDGESSAQVSSPVTPSGDGSENEDRGITPTTNGDDGDETFDLSNAIANEEKKEEDEEMAILATSPTISPLNGTGGISDEGNSTANTTDNTISPTPTEAPSSQPSVMPSSIPSSIPSIAPSVSPSNAPTDSPSTSTPSSLPSASMQPSSLPPALAAPELHLPTVSDMPSATPTTTNEAAELFDMVTFYVLAGQWDENQSEMTQRGEDWLLENLPIQQQQTNSSARAFMVHLGDWNGPVGVEGDREYQRATAWNDDDDDEPLPLPALDCSEQEFIQTHIDFSTCSVPVYFTPGSREYGDCPDPQGALSSYSTWLQDYDLRYWDYPQWEVWNDGSSGFPENWIFSYNNIVFAAINLGRGSNGGANSRDPVSTIDDAEWENRYEATLDWINLNYYDLRRNNQVFIIFASSGPEDETNREFYQELLSRIEFRWIRMQFVIVHRNLSSDAWEFEQEADAYSRRYDGIRNLDVITVQASVWPPMRVEIDLSNIIRAEVSVDQSTWFDEYVEAESL